jgi:glycosidase
MAKIFRASCWFETNPIRNIMIFWREKCRTLEYLDARVDGFRYDMAEMVPYEFWSYMNSAIKVNNPDAFLLARYIIQRISQLYSFRKNGLFV